MLLNKLVVCKFYHTVHRFHARVQSPTWTTYGKYLQESIMAVLTPKSGIGIASNSDLIILSSYITHEETCQSFF